MRILLVGVAALPVVVFAATKFASGPPAEPNGHAGAPLTAVLSLDQSVAFRSAANQKNMTVALRVSFSNHSASPVTNVQVTAHLIAEGGSSKMALAQLHAAQEEDCMAARRDADQHGPFNFGIAVAPGDTQSSHVSLFIAGRDSPIIYLVQGCADYTDQNARHGRILFRWRLGRMHNGVLAGIAFMGGAPSAFLPIADVAFAPDPVGGND